MPRGQEPKGSVDASAIAALLIGGLLALSGCSSAPPRQPPADAYGSAVEPPVIDADRRHAGLAIAAGMVGSPYRYGGDSPRGFDCSGLVYYAFRKAGIEVPRTTREQFDRSTPISLSTLEPGDLLFFKLNRRKVSHVGIYAGDGRFVHAPSSGKVVSYASLDDPFWQERLTGARRLD